MAHCGDKGFVGLIWEQFCCAEFNVSRDGHKEREFVDKHDIGANDDITVL
jgi:hypothetical protein